jgi:hypothetical protein
MMRGKHKLEGEVENKRELLAMLWFNNYSAKKRYYSGILDDVGYPAGYSHKLNEAPLGLRRDSVQFDDDDTL